MRDGVEVGELGPLQIYNLLWLKPSYIKRVQRVQEYGVGYL